jgi:hypothetical protein
MQNERDRCGFSDLVHEMTVREGDKVDEEISEIEAEKENTEDSIGEMEEQLKVLKAKVIKNSKNSQTNKPPPPETVSRC